MLNYILLEKGGGVDVNRVWGSDRAIALHCAIAGGPKSSLEIVKVLLDVGANAECLDASDNKSVNLIAFAFDSLLKL